TTSASCAPSASPRTRRRKKKWNRDQGRRKKAEGKRQITGRVATSLTARSFVRALSSAFYLCLISECPAPRPWQRRPQRQRGRPDNSGAGFADSRRARTPEECLWEC